MNISSSQTFSSAVTTPSTFQRKRPDRSPPHRPRSTNILIVMSVVEDGVKTKEKDIFYQNCSRYIGQVNDQFQRSGAGIFHTYQGVVIKGNFKNDKPDGPMTIEYPNKMVYKGTMNEQYRLDGKGILSLSSKVIEVIFNNGILSNSVRITYKNINGGEFKSYVGEVLHSTDRHFSQTWLLHGNGKLETTTGLIYEGKFNKDCMEGVFTLSDPSGLKLKVDRTGTIVTDQFFQTNITKTL